MLDATFAILDVDSSGFLEREELVSWVRVLRRMGGVLPEDRSRDAFGWPRTTVEDIVDGWLASSDADSDGRISRAEFCTLGPKLNLQEIVAQDHDGASRQTDFFIGLGHVHQGFRRTYCTTYSGTPYGLVKLGNF